MWAVSLIAPRSFEIQSFIDSTFFFFLFFCFFFVVVHGRWELYRRDLTINSLFPFALFSVQFPYVTFVRLLFKSKRKNEVEFTAMSVETKSKDDMFAEKRKW